VCVHACAHTCIQAFTGVSMLVVHMHMELQQDDFVRRPSLWTMSQGKVQESDIFRKLMWMYGNLWLNY